jgi:hypothetical protein
MPAKKGVLSAKDVAFARDLSPFNAKEPLQVAAL